MLKPTFIEQYKQQLGQGYQPSQPQQYEQQ
jgi:hypothetical protein